MKFNILDQIDFEKVNALLEGFNKTTGFVTAILDLQGNVLSKSGWRQICTDFHRIHPDTLKKCTISDTELAGKLVKGEKIHFYKCLNGLVDVAVPVVINGEHVANLFSGQFFFVEPDIPFFKKQAKQYGFEEGKYLAALKNVPVVSQEKVKTAMDFLLNMTQLISETTFQKLEQIELNKNIRESEEKFKAVFEATNVSRSITLPTGEINVNQAFCDLLGYSRNELQNKKWQDLTPEDEIPAIQAFINPLLTGEKSSARFEKRYICKDGSYKWTDVSTSIQRDKNGKPLQFITTVIDITERKQAQELLHERDYLLSSSQRAAHVGAWSWKIGDPAVYWSDETYRIYGLNPAMGAPSFEFFFEIIHPEDRPKMQEWPTVIISGLHPPPIEFRVMRPDGIYRVIQTDGDVIETLDGVPSRIAGTAYDITERKQAENALRQSEEKFSIMFRKAPFSAALSSISDLKLVDVNEQFEKYWGYSSAEAIGKTSSELGLHPDNNERSRLSAIFRESGFVRDVETKMKSKSGELKDVLINSDIVKIGNEQFVLSTVQNITERKQIEEKIRENNSLIRIATEKAKLGGWNVDLKENRSYWSDEVAAIHEMPPGYAPLVEDGINFYAPEWRDRIIKVFTDCAGNGVPYDEEMEIITSTGKRVWVRTIGEAVRDENGQIFKVQGAFQDISEQKLVEAKVREKDLQFRKLSANVPDLIFQFTRKPDGSYCVPVASEGIVNIFGCTPEDVVDDFTPIGKVIHPDDAERVMADIEYSARNLTYFTCEFRVLIPGKPIQWILSRSTPEKLSDGSITWYGFNANITERKHAEEEIKRQLDELQRWQAVIIGRESRVSEIKREVNELLIRMGEPIRYPSQENSMDKKDMREGE